MNDLTKKMYYYTSTETMQKILQNGNIWATNLAYMNDEREISNGLDEIRSILLDLPKVGEWLKKHPELNISESAYEKLEPKEILTDAYRTKLLNSSSKYTISFCEKKNLLSQWIAYAKESGVCIEMEFNLECDIKFWFYGSEPDEQERKLDKYARPQKILYYTQTSDMPEVEKDKTCNEILDRVFVAEPTPELLKKKWNEVSIYVKHYDFYQEEEYRINFETEEWPTFRIGYRTDKHILKPYLDVACENGWPVTAVMVGPGFNQQVVFDSLKFFLNHEKVRSSALRSSSQWQAHIAGYFSEMEQDLNGLEPSEKEKQKKLYDWLGALKEEEFEDGSIRANIQKRVVDLIGNKYQEYFNLHYLTVSGIIIQKSDIPYIY